MLFSVSASPKLTTGTKNHYEIFHISLPLKWGKFINQSDYHKIGACTRPIVQHFHTIEQKHAFGDDQSLVQSFRLWVYSNNHMAGPLH